MTFPLLYGVVCLVGATGGWKLSRWFAAAEIRQLHDDIDNLTTSLVIARKERDAAIATDQACSQILERMRIDLKATKEALNAAAKRDPVLAGNELDRVLHGAGAIASDGPVSSGKTPKGS